jgi:hypothetical protein
MIPLSKKEAEFMLKLAATTEAGFKVQHPAADTTVDADAHIMQLAVQIVEANTDATTIGAKFTYVNNSFILITENGNDDMSLIGDIIQATLREFGLKMYVPIEWGFNLRNGGLAPGAFGGGAMIVSAESQLSMTTSSWIASEMEDLKKQ